MEALCSRCASSEETRLLLLDPALVPALPERRCERERTVLRRDRCCSNRRCTACDSSADLYSSTHTEAPLSSRVRGSRTWCV